MNNKKLYKSNTDKMISGLLAGIGEYFNIDPNIIRIIFVVLLLITGVFPGVLAYIIAYFIIPDAPWKADKTAMPLLKPEAHVHTPPTTGAAQPVDPESAPMPTPEQKQGPAKPEDKPEIKTEMKTEPVEKEMPNAGDTMNDHRAHLEDVI